MRRCASEAIICSFNITPVRSVGYTLPLQVCGRRREMRLQLPAAVTALVASATDKMWEANVRATGKDQLRLNEDVEIRPSFGKGMGVFALRCACTKP